MLWYVQHDLNCIYKLTTNCNRMEEPWARLLCQPGQRVSLNGQHLGGQQEGHSLEASMRQVLSLHVWRNWSHSPHYVDRHYIRTIIRFQSHNTCCTFQFWCLSCHICTLNCFLCEDGLVRVGFTELGLQQRYWRGCQTRRTRRLLSHLSTCPASQAVSVSKRPSSPVWCVDVVRLCWEVRSLSRSSANWTGWFESCEHCRRPLQPCRQIWESHERSYLWSSHAATPQAWEP